MRLHPVALTRPSAVLGAMTLAMHVISRTTGSGWLVVVVSGLLSVLGLSALLPAFALTGIEVGVGGPSDGTAGRAVSLTVTVNGRARGSKLRLIAPASDWVRLDGPGAGPVTALPASRGVVEHVELEVRSAAPFGLVWWRRRLRVPLERPLEVGPAPLDAASPWPTGAETGPEAPAGAATSSPELVRGLRGYVPGDPPRLVSWVATARHGRLMVRELEGATARARLTLVVDLRGDDETAEAAASRAAGLAVAALREGGEVLLATAEAGGPRLGRVGSALQVSRRLARATADGPPAAAPSGGPTRVVGTGDR